MKIPVMLTVYDCELKEHSFGPIMVEIRENESIDPTDPWDWWSTIDNSALESLIPDMSCDAIQGGIRYAELRKLTAKKPKGLIDKPYNHKFD